MINQMTIIGLGYIGKSIATAIRSAYFTKNITGYDEDPKNLVGLVNKKIVDDIHSDLISAIQNSDLIVITTPLDQYEKIFSTLGHYMKETATVTDSASLKMPIIELAKNKLGIHFERFVPCHPIINFNNEKSIPTPDIFARSPIIITPTEMTKRRSINLVSKFWQKVGGETEIKSATENDLILATICHLPQILACAFMHNFNGDDATLRYINKYFIDFTSSAMQCPIVWSDIGVANREAIFKELTKFEIQLRKLKKLLKGKNNETVLEHFLNAKQLREKLK